MANPVTLVMGLYMYNDGKELIQLTQKQNPNLLLPIIYPDPCKPLPYFCNGVYITNFNLEKGKLSVTKTFWFWELYKVWFGYALAYDS